MKIEEIATSWTLNIVNTEAAVALWDGKAEQFGAKTLPTEQDSLAMRLIVQENMLQPGETALDVGCGGGRFSFALEALGAEVIGADFSPGMIRQCEAAREKNGTSAKFCVLDWTAVDLEEIGWSGRFDLVLANMTPAISSAETFMKLSEASRNWCLMVRPTRRKNSVQDKLTQLLGVEADTKSLDETLIYSFALLWLSGLKPKIAYEEQVWESNLSLEEAIRDYTLRLSTRHTLTGQQEASIISYLNGIAENGRIHETVETTIAAVYWQVNDTAKA
ncbi:MAG: methyltransferase domain-containing protein [Oscillospiraceae bacterium]